MSDYFEAYAERHGMTLSGNGNPDYLPGGFRAGNGYGLLEQSFKDTETELERIGFYDEPSRLLDGQR